MTVQDHEMSELLAELAAWGNQQALATADEAFKSPGAEWYFVDRMLEATKSVHASIVAETRCKADCPEGWHKTQIASELWAAGSFLMAACAAELLANRVDRKVFWQVVDRDPTPPEEMIEMLKSLGYENVVMVQVCENCDSFMVDGVCADCEASA